MRTIQPCRPLLLCLAILAATGCGKDAPYDEAKEESDPLVSAGLAHMERQAWDQAEQAFKQALAAEPLMARPHLDLATIYQQHKVNYIHAIYHYDRYLELRPLSEKAGFINEQKRKVAQALANTLVNSAPEVRQLVDEVNRLRQENAALKRQLAAAAPTPPSAQQPRQAPEAGAAAPPSTHRIYHVVAGDTLSKIATKFYGDAGQYDTIYEANRDSMRNPNDLRVGQTLVIPASGR